MSYRAEIEAGQTIVLYGRIYSWRQNRGQWHLGSDPLAAERAELLDALESHATAVQAAARATWVADRRAAREQLPPLVAMAVQASGIARAKACAAGDPAHRPTPGGFPTWRTQQASAWLTQPSADGQPGADDQASPASQPPGPPGGQAARPPGGASDSPPSSGRLVPGQGGLPHGDDNFSRTP